MATEQALLTPSFWDQRVAPESHVTQGMMTHWAQSSHDQASVEAGKLEWQHIGLQHSPEFLNCYAAGNVVVGTQTCNVEAHILQSLAKTKVFGVILVGEGGGGSGLKLGRMVGVDLFIAKFI